MNTGDVVYYYRNGWRTGVYKGTIEGRKNFGLLEIVPTCTLNGSRVLVSADSVKPIPTPADLALANPKGDGS